MPDFWQHGSITTLHDFGTADPDQLENTLTEEAQDYPLGLVLPVTAADMRADPFPRIVEQLRDARFIDKIVIVLGVAPEVEDYRETCRVTEPLGDKASVLWTDGPRIQARYKQLVDSGLNLNVPGKGRSVWTAFGYLLAYPHLKAFALHDCDIVDYDRQLLVRLCLPMADSLFDFEFCKAFYARVTDKMHGRVVRLLVAPLLRALISLLGHDRFLVYMQGFRYPLSGEFAVTYALARSNRIPSDWGLEVGTLAEVYRNTSYKRVCQVDLCPRYEHKHQPVSLDDSGKGLMKMATDILTTLFRTFASMGKVISSGQFVALRSAYLRSAQDAIRQYNADAVMNGLTYDRHTEEQTIEGFAGQISVAARIFQENPVGGEAIPSWTRVNAAYPTMGRSLREDCEQDHREYC